MLTSDVSLISVMCSLNRFIFFAKGYLMDKITKILIIGDSWANTIRKGGIGGISDKNPFTKALNRHGFSDFDTVGEKTVWGGMRADDFNKNEIKKLVESELTAYKDLVTIHMIVGGNDFLHEAVGNLLLKKSETEIQNYLNEIGHRIEKLIKFLFSVRSDFDILFSGYDYVDIIKAGQVIGFDTAALTFESFNLWFGRLNECIKDRISIIKNCNFIDNMGHFHSLDSAINSSAYYKEPINEKYFRNDGIHPNNTGNRIILDKCFQEYYTDKFKRIA